MQFGGFGIWQILIIAVVVVLIFGPRRLPELAKNVGQSVLEFRKGMRDNRQTADSDSDDDKGRTETSGHIASASRSQSDADAQWEKLHGRQQETAV